LSATAKLQKSNDLSGFMEEYIKLALPKAHSNIINSKFFQDYFFANTTSHTDDKNSIEITFLNTDLHIKQFLRTLNSTFTSTLKLS